MEHGTVQRCLNFTELQTEITLIIKTRQYKIEEIKLAVFISSTTGEGDPPDNAVRLIRYLKQKTIPADFLAGLTYVVLGSTYHILSC